jgi:Thiamine monophosphate kinase
MKTLHDIGEFGFIEQFAKKVQVGRDVIKGIGDDTAVMDMGGGECLLMTTDMLVESVHFMRTTMTPQEIGKKIFSMFD